MSETVARRTTREKKPSRQYWYDVHIPSTQEQDYSNIVTSKTQEQKVNHGLPQERSKVDESTLIARLFAKFVNSSNTSKG